jgi:type IX secretion system PorP/SprF family membrane protein
MKTFLLIHLSFLLTLDSAAQSPIAFRQNYFNPFLFNPAYAGFQGYSEIHLAHRQQWVKFNDAPLTSTFTFEYPTFTRVSLGLNFTTQKVVALNNSSVLTTFAYRIPFGSQHGLRIGISGGLGMNALDLGDADYSNDKTILEAAANRTYASGNFGFVYSFRHLHFGFTLPQLFGQQNVSPANLGNENFTQLKNRLYTLAYKFSFASDHLSVSPFLLYRQNRDGQDLWEGTVILNLKNAVWTGASYNHASGMAFIIGFNVKDRLRVAYDYEMPTGVNTISTSSHEFHVSLQIGRKKESKSPDLSVAENIASEVTPPENINVNPEPAKVNKIDSVLLRQKQRHREDSLIRLQASADSLRVIASQLAVQERTVEEAPPVVKKVVASKPVLMTKGIYVVVGAFKILDNALRLARKLSGQNGYTDSGVGIHPDTHLYLVYVLVTQDISYGREFIAQQTLKKSEIQFRLVRIE